MENDLHQTELHLSNLPELVEVTPARFSVEFKDHEIVTMLVNQTMVFKDTVVVTFFETSIGTITEFMRDIVNTVVLANVKYYDDFGKTIGHKLYSLRMLPGNSCVVTDPHIKAKLNAATFIITNVTDMRV